MAAPTIDRTNYNSLADDSGNNTDGTIWNKNQIKIVLLDQIDTLSQSLYNNALYKTITVPLPALITCSSLGTSALGSTAYVVLRAFCPMTIQRITIVPQADVASLVATSGSIVFWAGNNCSTMAFFNTTSTASNVAGGRINLGTITNATLAACADLRFAILLTSCGTFPASSLQVDYFTTST